MLTGSTEVYFSFVNTGVVNLLVVVESSVFAQGIGVRGNLEEAQGFFGFSCGTGVGSCLICICPNLLGFPQFFLISTPFAPRKESSWKAPAFFFLSSGRSVMGRSGRQKRRVQTPEIVFQSFQQNYSSYKSLSKENLHFLNPFPNSCHTPFSGTPRPLPAVFLAPLLHIDILPQHHTPDKNGYKGGF